MGAVLAGAVPIRRIAVDRCNAPQLAGQLEGDGFEMITFRQGSLRAALY
jgi:phage terminase large subunit-like protein